MNANRWLCEKEGENVSPALMEASVLTLSDGNLGANSVHRTAEMLMSTLDACSYGVNSSCIDW